MFNQPYAGCHWRVNRREVMKRSNRVGRISGNKKAAGAASWILSAVFVWTPLLFLLLAAQLSYFSLFFRTSYCLWRGSSPGLLIIFIVCISAASPTVRLCYFYLCRPAVRKIMPRPCQLLKVFVFQWLMIFWCVSEAYFYRKCYVTLRWHMSIGNSWVGGVTL